MNRIFRNLSILIFLCSFSFLASGQCSTCRQETDAVPEEILKQYKKNYDSMYRQKSIFGIQHSVSVDFSKEAITEFYYQNFIVNLGKYSGVYVSFINTNSNALPGQVHERQIGLMLMPSTLNCKIDMSGYSIINNSFDQDVNNNSMTKFPLVGSRQKYMSFTANYRRQFHVIDTKRYTKSARFNISIFKLFYELFQDATLGASYKGLRIDFGCYNYNLACGQSDPYQIALFLTPVKNDGTADYTVLKSFFNKKYSVLGNKDTFNHGELCPKNCPPEIN
jgi:hypothetical protein